MPGDGRQHLIAKTDGLFARGGSLIHLQPADQFGYASHSVLNAPTVELIHDVFRGAWIEVAGSSHLHRSCPGEQEFHHVAAASDSTNSYYGNIYRLRRFVDHAQRDRLNGR